MRWIFRPTAKIQKIWIFLKKLLWKMKKLKLSKFNSLTWITSPDVNFGCVRNHDSRGRKNFHPLTWCLIRYRVSRPHPHGNHIFKVENRICVEVLGLNLYEIISAIMFHILVGINSQDIIQKYLVCTFSILFFPWKCPKSSDTKNLVFRSPLFHRTQ